MNYDSLKDPISFVGKYFQYGITLVSAFILGLLLLFFKELTNFFQDILIPSLVVYTIGSGLIACIQILLTVSANTKAMAKKETPSGIKEGNLTIIIITHIVWFALFILYNVIQVICG